VSVQSHAGIDVGSDANAVGARALLRRARLGAQQGERALRRLGIQVERSFADVEPGEPR
jgi:hypothetical protein